MNKNTPDFSATLELVDHQLAEAENRLQKKRERKLKLPDASSPEQTEPDIDRDEQATSNEPNQKKRKATPNREPLPVLKEKERRRNLSLKVTEANEIRFHQLFHKMQLAGDSRRKQDLADEALDLLFAQYGHVFE